MGCSYDHPLPFPSDREESPSTFALRGDESSDKRKRLVKFMQARIRSPSVDIAANPTLETVRLELPDGAQLLPGRFAPGSRQLLL